MNTPDDPNPSNDRAPAIVAELVRSYDRSSLNPTYLKVTPKLLELVPELIRVAMPSLPDNRP